MHVDVRLDMEIIGANTELWDVFIIHLGLALRRHALSFKWL